MMKDDFRSAIELVSERIPEPVLYVTPASGTPTRSGEKRTRTDSRVFDFALHGVAPSELIVVTCTDREAREAIAADLAFHASRSVGRVLLATQHASATPLVDVLRTRERMTSLAQALARHHGRESRSIRLEDVLVGTRITSADASACDVKLVVACDVDEGNDSIGAWREVARRRAIPVVVLVSGRIEGWADPADAHIDLFRTHDGRNARFIARGVRPRSAASRRFAVVLGRDRGHLKANGWDPLLDGPTARSRWAPEADFDGVYCARPTLMTNAELVACLADPHWMPSRRREAVRVMELFAAICLGAGRSPNALDDVRDDRTRAIVEACGRDLFEEMSMLVGRGLPFTPWARDGADVSKAPPWSAEHMSRTMEEALPRATYDLDALRAAMRSNVSVGRHGMSGKMSTMVAGAVSALSAVADDEEDETEDGSP